MLNNSLYRPELYPNMSSTWKKQKEMLLGVWAILLNANQICLFYWFSAISAPFFSRLEHTYSLLSPVVWSWSYIEHFSWKKSPTEYGRIEIMATEVGRFSFFPGFEGLYFGVPIYLLTFFLVFRQNLRLRRDSMKKKLVGMQAFQEIWPGNPDFTVSVTSLKG